ENPDNGFALIKTDYIPECFYVDEGLVGGTYYYMTRLARPDGADFSVYSEILACTTMQNLPGVTSIEQAGANVNRLTISWGFPSDQEINISGFELFKSNTPTGIYSKLVTTGKGIRSFQDIGLTENTTYYY